MAELKRTLGLTECIFFGVGSILGAGIYALIGKVAGLSGNATWLSFSIASVAALFTALSYAELSAAFPRSGGEYVYATRAFGKRTGVFSGIIISFNGIISGAAVSLGFAGYLEALTGINFLAASLGIIVIIFIINVSGIKESATVNIIFTIIEAGGLFFVIYTAMPSLGNVNYLEITPQGFNGLLASSALAFFAYIGFEDIVKLAEETKTPEKNIPRALFGASIIVIVIYCLVSICAISVIPYQELGKSESPLADIINSRFGKTGVITISVIALFSTSNTILLNMLGASRVLLNMSKEIKLLNRFAYLSSKRRTPVTLLVVILIIMSSVALTGNIETIARIATVFIFITFILVNLTVIVLRIKEKELPRPYRVPLNIKNIPVLSVLGLLMILVLSGYNIYGLWYR